MAKKSTKSTKSNAKAATGKSSKSTKKGKSASQRIMEKFQVTDQLAAQPVVAELDAEAAVEAPVAEAASADENAAPVATGGDPAAESTTTTTVSASGNTGEPGATGGKRMGLVSAAIQILADAGADAAMNCHELVKAAAERGLWQPRAGKTPANTLYAALLREVRDKGEASRFRKIDRGKFSLNKAS